MADIWQLPPVIDIYQAHLPEMEHKARNFARNMLMDAGDDKTKLRENLEALGLYATEITSYLRERPDDNRLKLFLPPSTWEMLPQAIQNELQPTRYGTMEDGSIVISPVVPQLLDYFHDHGITDYSVAVENDRLFMTRDREHFRPHLVAALYGISAISAEDGARRLYHPVTDPGLSPEGNVCLVVDGYGCQLGMDVLRSVATASAITTPQQSQRALHQYADLSAVTTLTDTLDDIMETSFPYIRSALAPRDGWRHSVLVNNRDCCVLSMDASLDIAGIPAFTFDEHGDLRDINSQHLKDMMLHINQALTPVGSPRALHASVSDDGTEVMIYFDQSLATDPKVRDAAHYAQASSRIVRQAGYAACLYAQHMLGDNLELRYSIIPPGNPLEYNNPRAYDIALHFDAARYGLDSDQARRIMNSIPAKATEHSQRTGMDSLPMNYESGIHQGIGVPEHVILVNVNDIISPEYQPGILGEDGNIRYHFGQRYGLDIEDNLWQGNLNPRTMHDQSRFSRDMKLPPHSDMDI